jgi:hypothetical protein
VHIHRPSILSFATELFVSFSQTRILKGVKSFAAAVSCEPSATALSMGFLAIDALLFCHRSAAVLRSTFGRLTTKGSTDTFGSHDALIYMIQKYDIAQNPTIKYMSITVPVEDLQFICTHLGTILANNPALKNTLMQQAELLTSFSVNNSLNSFGSTNSNGLMNSFGSTNSNGLMNSFGSTNSNGSLHESDLFNVSGEVYDQSASADTTAESYGSVGGKKKNKKKRSRRKRSARKRRSKRV